MLPGEIVSQRIECVWTDNVHACVPSESAGRSRENQRRLHNAVRTLAVIPAEVSSVGRRLINVGTLGVSLTFDLKDQDRSAKKEHDVRPALLHWQLVLENGRVIVGSSTPTDEFRRFSLQGWDRIVPRPQLLNGRLTDESLKGAADVGRWSLAKSTEVRRPSGVIGALGILVAA